MPKYIDPTKVKLVELVRYNKKVRFSFYRDKQFWYEHEDGLVFPIALSEVDDPRSRATLLAEERAILFMRWIKKYIEDAKEEKRKLEETPILIKEKGYVTIKYADGTSAKIWDDDDEK